MRCPACQSENEPGRKFCAECGTPLAQACSACGSPNAPTAKFCGECGTALTAQPAPAAAASPPAAPTPAAERRLVTVLFADLVGFTAASEGRDAEETRELLSRYFETARTVIERYGGTVEKFIGDAVMAVWGTPVAQEDDAERAVRASLDLVAAVPELDSGLKARAGVLTGEAAVTIGAEGQGMVAGDLVNTASRIQSSADPGTVLVGEGTRRASEAAVAYADAGEHALKGKEEPVPLWQALRVIAARGGAQRSVGLEPPFVGRDRELRLVKDLFHACAEGRRAQLVSAVGIAGIGKSRLGWEFEKYIDGVLETVWWHRGRCLAYGEGVAYWALAEMVRMRCGMVEGEDRDAARSKLRATLEQHLPDADERLFVEPALAHLLGFDDGVAARGKEELFAAWRLLFERLADQGPAVLLFEDLQWADASLVEFIAYLLEWSRSHPIFVLCLARPDLQERHPEFGHGTRQTTLSLEPLTETAMEALLDGLVPGLPAELRARILERAEGVPLYAVETVRMLIDRGLLGLADGVYRPTGAIEELEVPETLQGLLAARLDGLSADERRLLQDASVLGKTFSRQSLAGVTGLAEAELEQLLTALVRKEVLGVQADPRSPERGQYGFLQDLVRRVAYETLARAERKVRHLAAAAQLEASGAAESEIVEVVAAHYLAAYEAAPAAEDAPEVRQRACALLDRAGLRARSLGATAEAARYHEQAAALADTPPEQARFLEEAAQSAILAAEYALGERLLRSAHEHFELVGDTRAAARVSGELAYLDARAGRVREAIATLEPAYETLADEADADAAVVSGRLASSLVLSGDLEAAVPVNEFALRTAQALRLQEPLARALTTQSWILMGSDRREEALALLRYSLNYTLEHDLGRSISVAYSNLSDLCFLLDRYDEALEHLEAALGHARRVGARATEYFALSEMTHALAMLGRWDEALECFRQLPEEAVRTDPSFTSPLTGLLEVLLQRGRLDEARGLLRLYEKLDDTTDVQAQAMLASGNAAMLRAEGEYAEALAASRPALSAETLHLNHQAGKLAFVCAVESAFALGDQGGVLELLEPVESLPPGLRSPYLDGHVHRARARLDGTEQRYKSAAAVFREYGFPFWVAVTQLEYGEWLVGEGRAGEAEPLLSEARETFERLEAAPWLQRVGGQAGVAA